MIDLAEAVDILMMAMDQVVTQGVEVALAVMIQDGALLTGVTDPHQGVVVMTLRVATTMTRKRICAPGSRPRSEPPTR